MLASVARRLCFLLPCALSVACTDSRAEDAGVTLESRVGSIALLHLERFAETEDPQPRLVAAAKVARYRAMQPDALLRLLGADARELDSCSATAGLGELDLGPEAQVELLSVGDIALRGGTTAATFAPRLFPALATTASGWFYAGEAEVALPRAELEEYVLSAPGESGVGAFEVTLGAPSAVLGLGLSGVSFEQPAVLGRVGPMELTWEAEDVGDRVELEIYAGSSSLLCTARDDGHFALSDAQLRVLDADDNATLVVRRVRVVSVDMVGIASAYARVATTRALPLQLR